MFPQLATLYFAMRQVGHNVIICATICFNLQCNNVGKRIEEKCCPTFRDLYKVMDTNFIFDTINCLQLQIILSYYSSMGTCKTKVIFVIKIDLNLSLGFPH